MHQGTCERCILLAAPALLLAPSARPVRVVVPYAPGGGADMVSRILFAHVSGALRQPFDPGDGPAARQVGAAMSGEASGIARGASGAHAGGAPDSGWCRGPTASSEQK